MSRVDLDRPFDPELLIRAFPGQLAFSGSAPQNEGQTSITGDFDYDVMVRVLERCFIDRSASVPDVVVQVQSNRRLPLTWAAGLFVGGTLTGGVAVMLLG